jgi:hypothetical protein
LKLTCLALWNSVAGMVRKLRVEYPGAVYHLMNRGIAERLGMGAPGYVNHLLYRRRKMKGKRYAKIKN